MQAFPSIRAFLQSILRTGGTAVLLAAPAYAASDPPPPVRVQWPVMGTIAAVSAPAADAANLPSLRDPVQAVFAEYERHFSIFRPESDLSRVNLAAGNGACLELRPDVAQVLHVALQLSRDSGGVFDPTIGPLMAAWGFRGGGVRHVPDAVALSLARAQVSWTHVLWDASASNRVRLARTGMRLDLGGLAKGAAVDAAYDRLRIAGCTRFLVDLGGNLRAAGEAADGRGGWRVGIRDPFHPGEILGSLLLTNGESVATSGNYERFVELDGHRYAHILDPRTSRPAEGVAGVTVLAPSGIQCDGLSATLFILGPVAGRKFLEKRPGCEAFWVMDATNAPCFATAAWARRFAPRPDLRRPVTTLP